VPQFLHPGEQQIVERAQQGDADAFADLYVWYAPAIFRYLLVRVGDSSVAEDLTSDVFLKAQEALRRYNRQGVPFAAWLFRIAHDRMVDHYRTQARHPSDQLTEQMPDDSLEPEVRAAAQAEASRLARAVACLTDEQKTVVQLHLMDGYSLEDTAQIMQKSIGAIKALQHRALANLAKQLQS